MSQESSSGSGIQENPSPSLLNNLRQFRFQKKSSLSNEENSLNGVVNNGIRSKYYSSLVFDLTFALFRGILSRWIILKLSFWMKFLIKRNKMIRIWFHQCLARKWSFMIAPGDYKQYYSITITDHCCPKIDEITL